MDYPENAREHYRVPAKIRIFYCQDSAEARNSMVNDYAVWTSHTAELPEISRQALADIANIHEGLKPLYAMLQWLNFKMDNILYQLRVVSRSNIFTNYLITTDLSISGFGFANYIDAPLGTKFLLALHLPDEPTHPIYTTGVLTRNNREEAGGENEPAEKNIGAILFDEISDTDRERLARFTLDYDRKLKVKQN